MLLVAWTVTIRSRKWFLMDKIAGGESGSSGEKVSQDSSAGQAYGVLSGMRDTIPRGLCSRLSAAGYGDLAGDDLLTLTAMNLNRSAARALIQKLGISGHAGSQSVKKMVLRGYLDFSDNPDAPRQSAIIITDRGRAVVEEALRCVSAMA
jgi:DNA-binding MarR family transcriptional regulator